MEEKQNLEVQQNVCNEKKTKLIGKNQKIQYQPRLNSANLYLKKEILSKLQDWAVL